MRLSIPGEMRLHYYGGLGRSRPDSLWNTDSFGFGALFMPIPLTVIGTDATGQGFKERTLVLGLNGRDCQYQSKHEVQTDCCLLLDFEYRAGGYKPCRVQGR